MPLKWKFQQTSGVGKKLRAHNGNGNGDEVESTGEATRKATGKKSVGESAYGGDNVGIKFRKSTTLKAVEAPSRKLLLNKWAKREAKPWSWISEASEVKCADMNCLGGTNGPIRWMDGCMETGMQSWKCNWIKQQQQQPPSQRQLWKCYISMYVRVCESTPVKP